MVDSSGLTTLRLDEAIGIVEATVGLLGLERALDRAPDVPAEGLEHTVVVLVQIPSRASWSRRRPGGSAPACSRLCPE